MPRIDIDTDPTTLASNPKTANARRSDSDVASLTFVLKDRDRTAVIYIATSTDECNLDDGLEWSFADDGAFSIVIEEDQQLYACTESGSVTLDVLQLGR